MSASAATRLLILAAIAAIAAPALARTAELSFTTVEKPRLIVLTDITNEPDDEESMVRLLAYANEFDIEALIATTSTWLRDKVRPENIRQRIEAYGRVRPNLLKHADGYPTAESLLAVTTQHLPLFGMQGVGDGKSSPGSRRIMEVVDKPDDRPVWVSVWGGANCLAQALFDVRASRTPEQLRAFIAGLRVYTISDQDDSGRWLRLEFPDLFYIVSPSATGHREYYKATWTGISGDRHYRNGPFHHFDLVDNPWLEANIIKNHGPLGALYPPLAYIMEGDTPSFLGLIDNGLASAVSPSFGGWGGRYCLYQSYAESRPIWTNVLGARDTVEAADGRTCTSAQATIWRWRQAFQHDFAARMDFCVADTFEKANHNPRPALNSNTSKALARTTAKPGDRLTLDASATTDPDNDKLTFHWFEYPEAGTCKHRVKIEHPDKPETTISIPENQTAGQTHIILQVTDNGQPPLYAYRRIIIETKP